MPMILSSSLIKKIKLETINDVYHRKTSSYLACYYYFQIFIFASYQKKQNL